MISNARIQSLFAKAILDVRFLDKLAGKKSIALPGEKKTARLPPQSIESLRLFSAFVAKVQHNYLWNDFQLTLIFIRKTGIELEIFGAYLNTHQQNRRDHPAMTINEKKDCFVRFFKNYTSCKTDATFLQANSILTHEDIYRQAKEKMANGKIAVKKNSTGRIGMESIPEINGRIWIAELYVNPALISTILNSIEKLKITKRKKRYCYWLRGVNEELQVFEVSKNMAQVMQAIDGKKNIGQLNALRGYSAIETVKGQKEIIKALASAGIVYCR